jgi:hypothetical protein
MSGLSPRSGFDWMAVSWEGPDEPPADDCSYCGAAIIPDETVPLILWNGDGWCARFCDACMAKWWGIETVPSFDDDDDDPSDAANGDAPDLGPCCICGGTLSVRTVIMLAVKNQVPGHGWGCVQCGLPADGASAVVCDACVARHVDGLSLYSALRFACRGYPAEDGRVSIEALTEAHEHDPDIEH